MWLSDQPQNVRLLQTCTKPCEPIVQISFNTRILLISFIWLSTSNSSITLSLVQWCKRRPQEKNWQCKILGSRSAWRKVCSCVSRPKNFVRPLLPHGLFMFTHTHTQWIKRKRDFLYACSVIFLISPSDGCVYVTSKAHIRLHMSLVTAAWSNFECIYLSPWRLQTRPSHMESPSTKFKWREALSQVLQKNKTWWPQS